jgi:hypothetical protein
MKFLYKYPQKKFPYKDLIDENARRGKEDKEYQIIDTGVFDEDRYWDIFIETAKETDDPDEILFRVTAWNRGPDPAPLHIIPQVWFRNTWSWGREPEDKKPSIKSVDENAAKSNHWSLGERYFLCSPSPGVGSSGDDVMPQFMFTENDTNFKALYDQENKQPYVKDAFHRYIVDGEKDAVNPAKTGTKCAAWFNFNEDGGVNPGECAGKYFGAWSFEGYLAKLYFSRSFPLHKKRRYLPGRGRVRRCDREPQGRGGRVLLQTQSSSHGRRLAKHPKTGLLWHDVDQAALSFHLGPLGER